MTKFNKVNYVSGKTKITADNLNEIQDEVLRLGSSSGDGGIAGPPGPQGEQGPIGQTGPQGAVGPKGDKGEQGIQGLRGDQGPKGDQGVAGAAGPKGDKGDKGDQGTPFAIKKIYKTVEEMNADFANEEVKLNDFVLITTEDVSHEDNSKIYIKGETEFKFINDLSGAQGIQGPAGAKGDAGAIGPQGPKGENGTNGEAGEQGPIGPKGEQGERGVEGPAGPKGEVGGQGPIGPAGSDGLPGAKGDKGDKGDAFTYDDFTPEQLEALKGETGLGFEYVGKWSATIASGYYTENNVVIHGGSLYICIKGHNAATENNPEDETHWSLFLPKGEQGPVGPKGEAGENGAAGTNGTNGKEVELQKSDTHVQWRYVGAENWTNLIALSEITGPAGSGGGSGSGTTITRYAPTGGEAYAFVTADGPGCSITKSGTSAELTVPEGVQVFALQVKFTGDEVGAGAKVQIKHGMGTSYEDFVLPHYQVLNDIPGNRAFKHTATANVNGGYDQIEITGLGANQPACVNLRLV